MAAGVVAGATSVTGATGTLAVGEPWSSEEPIAGGGDGSGVGEELHATPVSDSATAIEKGDQRSGDRTDMTQPRTNPPRFEGRPGCSLLREDTDGSEREVTPLALCPPFPW